MWGCFLMSGVKILHFLKDWWKSIPIHQNYTMALCDFNLGRVDCMLIVCCGVLKIESNCIVIEFDKTVIVIDIEGKVKIWSKIWCNCNNVIIVAKYNCPPSLLITTKKHGQEQIVLQCQQMLYHHF